MCPGVNRCSICLEHLSHIYCDQDIYSSDRTEFEMRETPTPVDPFLFWQVAESLMNIWLMSACLVADFYCVNSFQTLQPHNSTNRAYFTIPSWSITTEFFFPKAIELSFFKYKVSPLFGSKSCYSCHLSSSVFWTAVWKACTISVLYCTGRKASKGPLHYKNI